MSIVLWDLVVPGTLTLNAMNQMVGHYIGIALKYDPEFRHEFGI